MGVYKPEEFMSDAPPPRIIGSETEFSPHVPHGSEDAIRRLSYMVVAKLFGARPRTGLDKKFRPNGAKLYPDCGQIEYATPECIDSLELVNAEKSGEKVVVEGAQEFADEHAGIYRRTGTTHTGGKRTSVGYHQNLLTPPRYEVQRRDAEVMGAYLASRVIWAGAGMVDERFTLSQKAHDISGYRDKILMIGDTGFNRTNTGLKPMLAWSKHDSGGGMSSHASGWERLEIRYADATHSPWVRQMDYDTASLVLRVCENAYRFDRPVWQNLILKDLPKAVKGMARDLTFSQTFPTYSGSEVSALALQWRFARMAVSLIDDFEMQLPDNEKWAAYEWLRICEDISKVDFSKPETLLHISDRVEWAARYVTICTVLGREAVTSKDPRAVQIDLKWDEVREDSLADKYWRKKQPEYFAENELKIASLVTKAPQLTRANQRSQIMKKHAGIRGIDWHYVQLTQKNRLKMPDPYQYWAA